jgi:hypothetical protein
MQCSYIDIQSVSGEIVNILGGGSMDYSEQISSYKCVQFSMGVEIQLFDFGCLKIGRGGHVLWPPISLDLTPLDFCL